MINRILETYVRYGKSLEDLGLREVALPLSKAIQILEYCSNLEWTVLGGDVYEYTDSKKLEPTYENWFYSGNDSKESINKAYLFLQSLRNMDCFIVFVFE